MSCAPPCHAGAPAPSGQQQPADRTSQTRIAYGVAWSWPCCDAGPPMRPCAAAARRRRACGAVIEGSAAKVLSTTAGPPLHAPSLPLAHAGLLAPVAAARPAGGRMAPSQTRRKCRSGCGGCPASSGSGCTGVGRQGGAMHAPCLPGGAGAACVPRLQVVRALGDCGVPAASKVPTSAPPQLPSGGGLLLPARPAANARPPTSTPLTALPLLQLPAGGRAPGRGPGGTLPYRRRNGLGKTVQARQQWGASIPPSAGASIASRRVSPQSAPQQPPQGSLGRAPPWRLEGGRQCLPVSLRWACCAAGAEHRRLLCPRGLAPADRHARHHEAGVAGSRCAGSGTRPAGVAAGSGVFQAGSTQACSCGLQPCCCPGHAAQLTLGSVSRCSARMDAWVLGPHAPQPGSHHRRGGERGLPVRSDSAVAFTAAMLPHPPRALLAGLLAWCLCWIAWAQAPGRLPSIPQRAPRCGPCRAWTPSWAPWMRAARAVF